MDSGLPIVHARRPRAVVGRRGAAGACATAAPSRKAQGSGQVSVVSLEAVGGGSVGDVDILVAAVPVPVIIGGSRIIAQVLRGRVA
jgi:hypothetical protein